MMTSLLSKMFQRYNGPIYSKSHGLSLQDWVVVILHQKWKKGDRANNDDVSNLKAMIKYTFSSISQVLCPVALKFGILESFMLLITKNYKLVSKK